MSRTPDDYDDRPVRRELSGLDAFFANTNIVLLGLFGFCCGLISLVVGIIGLATCKDPVAKKNAMIVTIVSVVGMVVGVVLQLALGGMAALGGAGGAR